MIVEQTYTPWKQHQAKFAMGKAVFELYVVVALAALLAVVEDRTAEKCSDKLDPDVFRNVVSLYFFCLS